MKNYIKRLFRQISKAAGQVYGPRELRGIAVFVMIGLGTVAYRYGRELLRETPLALQPTVIARETAVHDSVLSVLSTKAEVEDSLFFALPADSLLPSGARGNLQHRSKVETLRPGEIVLNTAPKEELIRLPWVGPAVAERIMLYREEHGGFKQLEELERIRGIGPKRFAALRRFVRLH